MFSDPPGRRGFDDDPPHLLKGVAGIEAQDLPATGDAKQWRVWQVRLNNKTRHEDWENLCVS